MFQVGRLERQSSTPTAGSLLCQRNCSTSGPVKSFCISVLALCGTRKHRQDHPKLHAFRRQYNVDLSPPLNSVCKCSILKVSFCVPQPSLLVMFSVYTHTCTQVRLYRHHILRTIQLHSVQVFFFFVTLLVHCHPLSL